jgi:ribosomal protein S27E
MTSIEHTATQPRSQFKVVCEDCGGLSIKVEDLANSPATVQVRCGRCNAVRGTLAELHEMARRSTDSFEF